MTRFAAGLVGAAVGSIFGPLGMALGAIIGPAFGKEGADSK